MRIDLSETIATLANDAPYYLYTPNFDFGRLYINNDSASKELTIGRLEGGSPKISLLYYPGIKFTKNALFEGKYLYLRVQRSVYFQNISKWKFSIGTQVKSDLLNYYYDLDNISTLYPVYIFTGICIVMFTFTLVFFLFTKRLEFLWYCLYIVFLFLYLSSYVFNLHSIIFGEYGLVSYTFFQVTQVIINLMYILFVINYLNTKQLYEKLHIALKFIAIVLVIVIFLDSAFLLLKNFLGHIYILDFERIIMTIFGVVGMIYLLIKGKDNLVYFIVIGSFCYMIGALGLLFFNDRLYMIVGSSLEILIFSSGLTYKFQQEFIEKLNIQKEASKYKNNALRAQMNPHFIFNSLSSIQYLITTGNNKSAVNYLNKFSLLMRNLLENSIEGHVILEEEIETLKKYLSLEALRFDNSFEYNIHISKEVDTRSIEIPALIVQPFVENAIVHGLLPKSNENKKLDIRFKRQETVLICEIEDNGIGRSFAKANKSKFKNLKKSRGISVTQKRLEMINDFTIEPIQIIDKTDHNKQSSGTLVVLKILIS